MPILAEIADKMPTLATVWQTSLLIGLLLSAGTVCVTRIRLWLGLLPSIAGGYPVFIFTWPSEFDSAIVDELGNEYLIHQRLAGCLPLCMVLASWCIVAAIKKRNKAGVDLTTRDE